MSAENKGSGDKATAAKGARPGIVNRLASLGPRKHLALVAGLLFLLTLATFGQTLFSPSDVLSAPGKDTQFQFVSWRSFSFDQIRQGNFPLWNPHAFCGAPFFGAFQSALAYPPNWLHLILPAALAINWGVALHVYLAGLFTYLWARRRGLNPVAATVSAVLFMFCGAYFLHVYAGHLTIVDAAAWIPLIFLAIDALLQEFQLKYVLIGAAAGGLQILAGHPQTVFCTAIAAMVYVLLSLIRQRPRPAALLGLLGMGAWALGLSAVQILADSAATAESFRAVKLPWNVASSFSLPPESLLTLLTPGFFGDIAHAPYWGRSYWWEMTLFVGAAGAFLAGYGVICGQRQSRRMPLLGVAVVLLVLSLGANTPLFQFLYDHVPGFDRLRGSSKFMLPASLFLALLAGIGLDRLLRNLAGAKRAAVAAGAMAVIIGIAAIALGADSSRSTWQTFLRDVEATGEMQEPLQTSEANLVGEAQSLGSLSLAIAAGTLVAVAALLFVSRAAPAAVYGVAALAILELFIFARTYRATFPLASAGVPRVQQFLDQHPGDYRILNVIVPNAPLSADDIWGCDAGGTPLRYAEFMAVTQGRNPDAPSPYLNFQSFPPIYSMLRLHYLFWQEGEFSVAEIPNPLPRLLLVQSYRVLPSRDRIFEAMSQNFDPAKQVILEQEPDVHPLPTDQTGTVRLIDSSTDRLTIEADVPNPCILLITDGYSKDWHARALPGGVQQQYQVLPANYVLRAIPLGTGHHSIRLEYRPRLFVIGGWVSLLSLGGLAVTTGYALLKRRRQRQASGKPPRTMP